MKIFLSYSEEDQEIAGEISATLRGLGIDVYDWMDQEVRGRRFIRQIETAMREADAFFALISLNFLQSDWCRRERELAIQREQALQARDPNVAFVHVLMILELPPDSDLGFLGGYDWLDLTNRADRAAQVRDRARRIRALGDLPSPGRGEESGKPPVAGFGERSPSFRNREDELDKVLRGLTNTSGQDFWLVIAPPQLGKTWFLERVSTDKALAEPYRWMVHLVDLRTQPADVRTDAGALLALLFGRTPPGSADARTLRGIAQEISRSGRPHLCLLDSAELLAEETASTLRACLCQIYQYVQNAGKSGVRLGLIVASRSEDEWKGVTPQPRLSALALTEFKADVVQHALQDLATEMNHTFSAAEVRQSATLVRNLTEGLPALLVQCLQWIRTEEWVEMDRLASQEVFAELADPYIERVLLTQTVRGRSA